MGLRSSKKRIVVLALAAVLGAALTPPATADPVAAAAAPAEGSKVTREVRVSFRYADGTTLTADQLRAKVAASTEPLTPEQARREANEVAVATGQKSYRDSAEFGDGEQGRHDESGLTALGEPPDEPDGTFVDNCLSLPGAESAVGRIHNRFQYCQRGTMVFDYWTIHTNKPPEHEGKTEAVYNIIGLSSNQTRKARIYFRIEEDSVDYDWGLIDNWTTAPDQSFVAVGDCRESLTYCHGAFSGIDRTWGDWDRGDWAKWDIYSHENQSTYQDKVLYHRWFIKFTSGEEGDFKMLEDAYTPDRQIRCDSATYFPRAPQACVFSEVLPHITYSTGDRDIESVAFHIKTAQDFPNDTYPLLVPDGVPRPRDKKMPGRLGSASDPGLHRYDPANTTVSRSNEAHKEAACYRTGTERDWYVDLWLPRKPEPPAEQCDEYPFASTIEGAAHPDWDFSVRPVPQRQNSVAGGRLGAYYTGDRILYTSTDPNAAVQDEFWVDITDGGSGGSLPAPVNEPPTVNAGADVTGDEGARITLNGYAHDRESTPALTWTVSSASGTDAGAACVVADPHAARTTVTCNDDGEFVATLTADDGVNGPVGDRANVTVRNVAPRVAGSGGSLRTSAAAGADLAGFGPEPWSVYRAGTDVTVTVPVSDPGTNDSHTCVVVWDDGVREEFAATGKSCDRTHRYAHPGMYTIAVTVTDDDLGSRNRQTMVVAYDPDAGFATGGGHLASPAPTEGKAHFQFNPKYLPADAGPEPGNGKVAFRVQGTDFAVDSDRLEWLVVTPDDRLAVKGKTADGRGFVLYGYDPGRLRIVVWDLKTGAYPVRAKLYDNRPSLEYDLDLADPQGITAGAVRVHN
ncbi:PKD domain-containing protein [Streptomyces sp. NPDC091371]|uniref:NucA/NucB deoxyribonuclease domain-containing protein n=1 Tax=Streptomyces sp. NPDC091371 TaxID=3155303 RepID=UPI003438B67C